jgi:hypothetical protein
VQFLASQLPRAARPCSQSVARCPSAGQETLIDEDLGEEAVEEELAPLAAQRAVVQARLGMHAEALAALEGLAKLPLDQVWVPNRDAMCPFSCRNRRSLCDLRARVFEGAQSGCECIRWLL